MSAPARPWLHVVGIGDGGLASLSAAARAIVETGEVLVGGERHLDLVGDHPGERLRWRCPLEADILSFRGDARSRYPGLARASEAVTLTDRAINDVI